MNLIRAVLAILFGAWATSMVVTRLVGTAKMVPVDCRILESRLEGQDGYHRCLLKYEYVWEGHTNVSSAITDNDREAADFTEVSRLTEQYRAGSRARCYVYPATPDVAVLKRASYIFPIALLPFALAAIWIGVKELLPSWSARAESKFRWQRIKPGFGFVAVVGIVFLIAGLVGLYFGFLRPLSRLFEAQDWVATPCAILTSEVRRHADGKHTSYTANILYEYQIAGRLRRSNRYDLAGAAVLNHGSQLRRTQPFPMGSRTVCYVNPKDLDEAILVRRFSGNYLINLWHLIFVAIGVGLTWFSLVPGSKMPSAK